MKKLLLLLLCAFLLKASTLNAQNEKFKALFLYNFTKYIDWPEKCRKGDFVISVIGSSKIANELNVIASKKKVGNQKLVIRKLSNPSQITNGNIVYLASSKSGLLRSTVTVLKGKNALLVTDGSGLAQKGAGITFVEHGGKPGFEIKKQNIECNGLKVGGSLLTLGTVVN